MEIPRVHPELKELVAQASRALARLDANRLEELAFSCQALNSGLPGRSAEERAALAREACEATADMDLFGRVLEATRANLKVMNRLRELHQHQLEYCDPRAERWASTESQYGHD